MVTFRISCTSSGNQTTKEIIEIAVVGMVGVAEDAPGRQRNGAEEL